MCVGRRKVVWGRNGREDMCRGRETNDRREDVFGGEEQKRGYLPLSFLLNSCPPLASLSCRHYCTSTRVMVILRLDTPGEGGGIVTNRRAAECAKHVVRLAQSPVIKLYYISGIFIKHTRRAFVIFIRVP